MINIFFHPLIPLDMGPLEYFAVLGRALFTAQHFETNCRALAAYFSMRVSAMRERASVVETPAFRERLDRLWKQTLGRHIHDLQSIFAFPPEITQVFDAALEARNEIAHWLTVGIDDHLDSEIDSRIAEIRMRVVKIAAADKCVAVLLHAANKDPLPASSYFSKYEETVANWVCQPAFD